jgi:tetratricopeptide (TPR) repeat protein
MRIFLLAILLTSCASTAVQTEALLKGPRNVPTRAHVAGVPFVQQTEHFCGPATLTMALRAQGHDITLERAGAEVYTPGRKGSLQMDMISAARREGMLSLQIQGMENLLRELAAGHPVIVLENLMFNWYPWWHYSVALGYDLDEPAIVMHSGSKRDWHYSLRKFERNWKYADYWGLVILPPGELSASAGELEHAAAAAGLEQLGMLDKAALTYEAMLLRWPESFGALLGMGNVEFARGHARAAVPYLERATRVLPSNAAAWHNRAVAEGAAGMPKRAQKSAARALELASPTEVPAFRESLKEWIPRAAGIASNPLKSL